MKAQESAAKLAYDMTYHKFMLNRDKARSLFTQMDVAEYIALHRIAQTVSGSAPGAERTYLTELAKQLEMPLSGVSRMAGRLRDRGLVLWSHTGNGSEGTFVSITDSGFRAMKRQDELLEAYYGRVADRFGREKLLRLLDELGELEQIMDEEFTDEGVQDIGNDET